ERQQPGHRCGRRTGLPGADPGEPATGPGARAGGGIPGHPGNGAHRGHGLIRRLNHVAGHAPPARVHAVTYRAMTDSSRLRILRARKRADHLVDIRDEIASALTHGLGAMAALAAGAVLITLAAIYGDAWQLAGAIVFGVALLLLYVASTLYHAIQHPVAKGRLKVFDHCAIYLLIAGTYTPFTLIGLRGPWGWGLFAAIWTLALAGVVFKLFFTGRFRLLSTLVYIAMGWLVVFAA